MTKDQIRKENMLRRNQLSREEQRSFSDAVRERLIQTDAYRNCISLFTFLSFQTEIDTHEIVNQALLDKKRVYLPRVEHKNLEFYEITGVKDLELSKLGILEPKEAEEARYLELMRGDRKLSTARNIQEQSAGLSNIENFNLMLMPGLAFDRSGNRIGYGAGFYDRYLARFMPEHFYKIAIAYDFQVVDRIPTEEFDVKAEEIITPTERIRCRI